MFAQLSQPRRKKRAPTSEESPLPVPIASITNKPASNERWFYYNATLKDGSVYVVQEGDIHFLYKMGFFGKGMLSRGKPQHARFTSSFQGLNRKNLPPSERHFQQQRFKTVRKQRYERHLAWYKQLVKRKQTQTNIEQTDGNLEDDTDKCEGNMLEAEEEQKKHGKHPVQEDSSSVISSSSSSGEEDDVDDSVISENTKIPTKPLNVDSESKLGEVKAVKKLKTSVKKEDPYKVYEYLQLSLEEAFFLSYGLGCLALKNDKEESMNLTDMWKEFCNQQPTTFLGNYIAYHYYRSKGWVPKLGVKFGAEFILYKKGPPFYHASYSVIIKMVDQRSLDSIDGPKERWSRWAGLNRVTETVAKEVLFCYIIKPTTLTDEELMSPKCISSFTIHEVVMKRIVPSRERTNPQLPPEIS